MRRICGAFVVLCGLAALTGGCGAREVNLNNNMTVTAHAGALRTEDNTLDSVETGLAFIGHGNIEVDVRFLPDGTPVLGHDEAGGDSPLLEDVFALMQGYPGGINLDMKEKTNVNRVAELVAQYGLQGRSFMTGIEEAGDFAAFGLPYYLNSSDVDAAKQAGALGINISYKDCSAQLVQAAHGQGLLVSVWTVDKAPAMRRMLRLGVDNITTRRPDKLLDMMAALE